MRTFRYKAILATAMVALISLGASAAQADPVDDGSEAMDRAGDTSLPITDRAQGWSDAQEAAGKIVDEVFGTSDDTNNDSEN